MERDLGDIYNLLQEILKELKEIDRSVNKISGNGVYTIKDLYTFLSSIDSNTSK